jgi:hypothetical protein
MITAFPAGFWRDARLAVRRLIGAPLFTLFAIASLALGVGATTAAYSLIQAFTWPRFAIGDIETLALVADEAPRPEWARVMTWDTFAELRRQQTGLEDLAAVASHYRYVTDREFAAGGIVEAVTGNYFQTMRVAMLRGRPLQPADEQPSAPDVVVVSEAFWRLNMNEDPAVLGRVVRINGRPFAIVGVAGPDFSGVARIEPGRPRRAVAWMTLRPGGLVTDLTVTRVTVAGRLTGGHNQAAVSA